MTSCPTCGAPKPNDEWDWGSAHVLPCDGSAVVMELTHSDAVALYELLSRVRGQQELSNWNAGPLADVVYEAIDAYERGMPPLRPVKEVPDA